MKKTSASLSILLFIIICALGLNLLIRQVAVDTLSSWEIRHAVATRLMDVVFKEYPNASNGQLEKIQTKLEGGRSIEDMVGIYLDHAVAAVAAHQPFTSVDVEDEIHSMASETLVNIQSVMGQGKNAIELRQKLTEKSEEVTEAMYSYVQSLIENFQFGMRRSFVMAYYWLSSALLRITCIVGIVLVLGALLLIKKRLLLVIDSIKWPVLLSGLFLGVFIPLVISGTFRFLAQHFLGGRIDELKISGLVIEGGVLIVAGGVFFVVSRFRKNNKING